MTRSGRSTLPWAGLQSGLVLVRHARTAWNVEGRFMGRADLELDAEGARQAAALGARLAGAFDHVCSSPSRRAIATARVLIPPPPGIGGSATAPAVVEDLREVDQGELEGLVAAEARERWPAFFRAWAVDPEITRCPGGESLGEARDRALAAIEAIAAREEGRIVAVVTHQLVAAAVLCTLSGRPLASWRELRLGHTAGVPLVRRGGALVVAGAPSDLGGVDDPAV